MCHHITSFHIVHNVAAHILRFPWLSVWLLVSSVAFEVARKFNTLVLVCSHINVSRDSHIHIYAAPHMCKNIKHTQNWNTSNSTNLKGSLCCHLQQRSDISGFHCNVAFFLDFFNRSIDEIRSIVLLYVLLITVNLISGIWQIQTFVILPLTFSSDTETIHIHIFCVCGLGRWPGGRCPDRNRWISDLMP